jgi:HAE1 family hydrophobic/amphiphilic exporter-1
LKLPPPVEERKGVLGRMFTVTERGFERVDDGYRKLIHLALAHRPTVVFGAAALTIAAFLILPSIPSELVPQTDEGEVTVSARMPVGTRVERTEAVMQRL